MDPTVAASDAVEPMDPVDVAHLRRCIELAWEARARGDEPFGSVLVGPDGAVLHEVANTVVTDRDRTAHPELGLARWASQHLDEEQRVGSTVYTSCEHCAMCAAGHYWAGVGRIVFALGEHQLISVLPPGGRALALSTRELFTYASHPVAVAGPCAELEAEALAVVSGFWS
jgi:tRNA(Arg) A34 adenosine deaminase TadA